jgi:hypothetical protein
MLRNTNTNREGRFNVTFSSGISLKFLALSVNKLSSELTPESNTTFLS